MTPKRWLQLYAAAGLASWAFLQFFIVGEGKPYWQGLGGLQGQTGALNGLLWNLEVIALWPVALAGTWLEKNAVGGAG